MRNEGHSRFLDGIVTATFEGRDEDHLWIGGQDQLGVEIAFHAYLHDAPVCHTLVDVFVEEVLGAGDAFYHIQRAQCREVGELQHGHHQGALHGHFHLRVTFGNLIIDS